MAAPSTAEGAPVITEKPTFLTSWLCPYVQRVWIAMNYKQIERERVEIDLQNKPPWFLQVSPFGKVPVITYKEGEQTQVLYESIILCEWAEDYVKMGPSLLPEGAAQRANARIIMSRYDSKVVSNFYKLMMSKSREDAHAAAKEIHAELAFLEGQIHPEGPYFLGPSFSLVDCVLAPWLLRAHLLKHYRGFDLLETFPKLSAYTRALEQHPAVKESIHPPEGVDWHQGMVEVYAKYGGNPVDYFSS